MIYFITYLLISLGLIKKSKILYVIQIIWLFLIMAGNFYNADYVSYSYRYQIVSESNFINQQEILFDYLMLLSKYLGFSYQSFLCVSFGISILLLGYSINSVSKKPNIVLSLFMLYPLIDSIIQIRTFISLAIMIYSFRFLLNQNKKSDFYFIICVLVASGFHNLSFIYLVFLLAKHLDFKKCILVAVVMFISLVFLFIIYPEFFSQILSEKVVDRYFSDDTNRITFIKAVLLVIWQGCGLFCLLKFKSRIVREKICIQKISADDQYELAIKMNIIMFSIAPFYLVTSLFIRVYRNLLVVNYISLSNLVRKEKMFDYFIFIIYVVLSFIYFNMISNNMFDSIYRVIFENNLFIN